MLACPSIDQWHRGVPGNIRLPTVAGAAVLLAWIFGFGAWAAFAPLDGAVVAAGSFVATGQNKFVQHLEGGIVRDVLVKEGDLVEAQQPLVRLDDTAARAKLRRLVLRQQRLVTMQARLRAEIHGENSFALPAILADSSGDPEIATIYERQKLEMQARRAKLAAEEQVLRKEIAGLQESIIGYESQVKSINERIALFAEELKDKNSLLARQLVRKTEVFAVQRAEAGLSGQLGELLGRVADARERVARANQQIVQLHSAATQKSVEELRQTETELDDVQEQIRTATDVVARTEVRAPVRGIVVKLHQHTRGGVVAPGAVLLELLPVNDELIIEARVNPNEVSHVKEGQDALVRLSSLNQRLTPMIQGKVVYLSADIVSDQGPDRRAEQAIARRDSYIVRVRLDQQDLRAKTTHFQPTPGMPADVFIKTGERTFFDYIMRPVFDSFSRAFREA
ncbi:MAG TPA: HlyD family type I secretion periplasmic adaptor subunit [Hyphomicrobiaceae bacterium]|jgi:HlyD family secretion protein|nr:HlyD family type I secretion periplasmic adaptor subunit [Hyphomicrobiaceae bacterium]